MGAMTIHFKQGNFVVEDNVTCNDTFAKAESDLFAVIVQGTSPVSVQILNNGVLATGSYDWTFERDGPGVLPAITGSRGAQISFLPSVDGNYKLVASQAGVKQSISQIAIVGLVLTPQFVFKAGWGYLRFSTVDPSPSQMKFTAILTFQCGGRDDLVKSKIKLGNVGNVIGDNLTVDYPANRVHAEGTAVDSLARLPGPVPLPMLDTTRQIVGKPYAVFRSASSASTVSFPNLAATAIRVDSKDYFGFDWADPHPGTGAPAGQPTGALSFVDYIVAYSCQFPSVYVTCGAQPWSVGPCGNASLTAVTSFGPDPKLTGVTLDRGFIYLDSSGTQVRGIPTGKGRCSNTPAVTQQLADFLVGLVVAEAVSSANAIPEEC
jgi:hypothetical protein